MARSTADQRVQPRRHAYSASFKLQIVQEALLRPASNRIKPVCRLHPGIEPVQLRKWIRNAAALKLAEPSAKCVASTVRRVRVGSSIGGVDAAPYDVSAPAYMHTPPRPAAGFFDDTPGGSSQQQQGAQSGGLGTHGDAASAPLSAQCSPQSRRALSPAWPLAALASPATAEEQKCAAEELLQLRHLVKVQAR